jgi:CubicO group peptidase (beta-lactamase class C family)
MMATMNSKSLLSALLILLVTPVLANPTPPPNWGWVPPNFHNLMAGGYAWMPGMNKTILEPSASTKKIETIDADRLTPEQKKIVERARIITESKANLSLILVQNGKIIFEHYRFPSSETTPMMSWSMSKSLTGMLVGIQHCKGNIKDLDAPAKTYVPSLAETGYGSVTVRDLLKMSSGTVPPPTVSGANELPAFGEVIHNKITIESYLMRHANKQRSLFGEIKSGTTFVYKDLDTAALEMIVNATSPKGFVAEFKQEIWDKINAEGFSIWMNDRTGRPMAYSGFNAVGRDWIRLGMFAKNLLNGDNNCIRDYMRKATTHQINTDRPAFTQFGYQIWVANWSNNSSFWWRGFKGQRVAVDPKKDLIMYVGSTSDDYQSQLYELFRVWQQHTY